MWTLARTETVEQDIRKSRFRACAGPVDDEEEARRFIAARSAPDAGHNCWAFRTGDIYRFSDDGEPGGTGGKPILQAIDGQGLGNVAVVVSRWFGGVLLGTGGLARAYGGTAAACLRAAGRREIVAMTTVEIGCAFPDAGRIRARLDAVPGARVEREAFSAAGVKLTIVLPSAGAEAFVRLVTDITRGHAAIVQPDA